MGAGELAGLTEITFVEETDPNGVPDAAPPMARETTSSAPVQQVSTKASQEAPAEHFQRAQERADNAPHGECGPLESKRRDACRPPLPSRFSRVRTGA